MHIYSNSRYAVIVDSKDRMLGLTPQGVLYNYSIINSRLGITEGLALTLSEAITLADTLRGNLLRAENVMKGQLEAIVHTDNVTSITDLPN